MISKTADRNGMPTLSADHKAPCNFHTVTIHPPVIDSKGVR